MIRPNDDFSHLLSARSDLYYRRVLTRSGWGAGNTAVDSTNPSPLTRLTPASRADRTEPTSPVKTTKAFPPIALLTLISISLTWALFTASSAAMIAAGAEYVSITPIALIFSTAVVAESAGKTSGLNLIVPEALGEIIVFSDANSIYAKNTLNQTAGTVAEELLAAVEGRKRVTEEQLEYLWSRVVGRCRERLGQARTYRRRVVESAKADAIYLNNILPEYKKRPRLFVQKVYLDAIEEVFMNVDEKIIIQPTSNAKSKEVRVLLNRDPKIKKSKSEETK